MFNPQISVVVTVLNEVETVEALVTALQQQTLPPAEIVIVDGGSTDGTRAVLQSLATAMGEIPIQVLVKPGNRSVGRNWGIQQATSELIAVTDAGCAPFPDWLAQLYTTYQETQAPVIAGYYEGEAVTPFAEAVIPYALVMPDRVNPQTFLPATRSLLMEKQVWQAVGGFDPALSDNEDYAFARSIKAQEFNIAFAPEAKVKWFPRSNLRDFGRMIFRFARGDIQAGIVRPKVVIIFIRYSLFLVAVSLLLKLGYGWLIPVKMSLWLGIYSVWAIVKNIRYVPRGWYWLPVLQIVSDLQVMRGSLAGMVKNIFQK